MDKQEQATVAEKQQPKKEQAKRGRGRPPKAKIANKSTTQSPVEKDPLLRMVQHKFLDTYGFEPTEYQSKQFLLTLVAQITL